jgi:hypothetical protein
MATIKDVPYMLTSNGYTATVSYLEGDTWLPLGDNSIGSGEYSSVNNAKLVVCNDTPYVLYNDHDYNVKLYGYDYSTNLWSLKYSSNELSQYTAITSSEDSIYLAYTVGSYPYSLNVLEYDTLTGDTKTIGENLSDNACNVSISYSNNSLVVSYRDLNDNSIPKVATYSNGIWETYNLSSEACSMVTSTSNGESTIIATTGNSCGLYLLTGDGITTLSVPTELEGSIFSIEPLMLQSDVYLTIGTQNSSDFSAYHLVGNSWEKLGNSLSKEYVNFPSVTYANGNLYVGYVSTFGTLTVKSYATATTSNDDSNDYSNTLLLGDLNSDGSIDCLDLLALKRYILGIAPLDTTAIPLADLNSDGYINLLDFLTLKHTILYSVL